MLKRIFYACASILLLALAAIALDSTKVAAAPVSGFTEEFPGTSTSSWSGGTPFSNPGAGGYLGPADGYLLIVNTFPSNFGIRSAGAEYTGNWAAAGITQVRVWLNDVGADDALEIHLAVGNGASNFWQYNVGFLPPLHSWGEYVVDLTSSANWTRIAGTGSFADALAHVDRVLLRHDPAPYSVVPSPPDAIAADMGIDHLVLTSSSTPARTSSWGQIKALYH